MLPTCTASFSSHSLYVCVVKINVSRASVCQEFKPYHRRHFYYFSDTGDLSHFTKSSSVAPWLKCGESKSLVEKSGTYW